MSRGDDWRCSLVKDGRFPHLGQLVLKIELSFSNVQLNNVFIVQHVIARHGLAVVDAAAPDTGRLELVGEVAMNQLGHLQYGTTSRTSERRIHVRRLSRLLAVDADDVE